MTTTNTVPRPETIDDWLNKRLDRFYRQAVLVGAVTIVSWLFILFSQRFETGILDEAFLVSLLSIVTLTSWLFMNIEAIRSEFSLEVRELISLETMSMSEQAIIPSFFPNKIEKERIAAYGNIYRMELSEDSRDDRNRIREALCRLVDRTNHAALLFGIFLPFAALFASCLLSISVASTWLNLDKSAILVIVISTALAFLVIYAIYKFGRTIASRLLWDVRQKVYKDLSRWWPSRLIAVGIYWTGSACKCNRCKMQYFSMTSYQWNGLCRSCNIQMSNLVNACNDLWLILIVSLVYLSRVLYWESAYAIVFVVLSVISLSGIIFSLLVSLSAIFIDVKLSDLWKWCQDRNY